MKILKYWKQRSNGFNLEENSCEVAVKKVKGNFEKKAFKDRKLLNSFYWLLPDKIIKVYLTSIYNACCLPSQTYKILLQGF